jgi:trigger factor
MALVEGCKHALEITVPLAEVESETGRVVAEFTKKARLPGFRAGKVPTNLIRSRFASEIRQDVLDHLIPKHFRQHAEREGLNVIGNPTLADVHFHAGEPLTFKVEFEVAPTFDLQPYRELEVAYQEPVVAEEDINQRIEALREQKAEYINVDPRPVVDGDYAVVSLNSISGLEGQPISEEELSLYIGGPDTVEGFSENLRGLVPGDVKEFEVTYPSDFGNQRLAGKIIKFHAMLKVIRRKELPEINDDFAKDLGDYQGVDELREAIRRSIFGEREYAAQREAKDRLVEKLVSMHQFPVPEAFVERQIELTVESRLRMLAAQGVDPSKVKLDWEKLRESQREKAVRDVRASLLLDRIASAENIDATSEDIDREIQRTARQEREPIPAARRRMEQDGSLRRIASHFRTEKTLNFLFEHARKTEPEAAPETTSGTS